MRKKKEYWKRMLNYPARLRICLSCRRAQVRGEKLSVAALLKASWVTIIAAIASDRANT